MSCLWSPWSVRLGMGRQIRSCVASFFAGCVKTKVSAYTDDITVFVSRGYDIKAAKAVKRYEVVAGSKINFDKSSLWLSTWRGGVPLPGLFRWSDGPVRILGMWFGPGLRVERNWLEVRAKVEAQMGTCLRRRLSLKGRVEVCAVYIFLLILHRLSVHPLFKVHRLALIKSLSKLLWSDRKPMVCREVCNQHFRNGGLGMPDLESHWLAERLTHLDRSLSSDTVWGQKVKDVFLYLESDHKAEVRRKPKGAAPFTRKALSKLPRSSDLSRSRKEL